MQGRKSADAEVGGGRETGDLAAANRHLDISGRVLADRRFWYWSDHYQ